MSEQMGESVAGRRGSMGTIFLVVFIDMVGFGIVLPNLQLYGRDFSISNYFWLTLLGATYSIFQFIFAPLLGAWSDRIGRRPVLLISQIGTLVGFLVLYAAHFYERSGALGIALLFASRVLDGASGGNISTAMAYVADITVPEKRARGMGIVMMAFGLGFIFGPPIGGLTAYWAGLSTVPLVASAFSAIAVLMTCFWLPESLVKGRKLPDVRRFTFGGLRRALRRPAIGTLILMFFAYGIAFAGMEQTLSLIILRLLYFVAPDAPHDVVRAHDKAASLAAGMLFFFIGIIVAVIQGALIGRLTKRFGEVRLAITGPALIGVGMLLIAMAGVVPAGTPHARDWIWTLLGAGCAILAIGSSLFTPSMQSLISRHAGAHEQGEILGANQGMASLARAIGPLAAGLLFQYISPAAPYFAAAAITLGVAFCAAALRNQIKLPDPVHPSDTHPTAE